MFTVIGSRSRMVEMREEFTAVQTGLTLRLIDKYRAE